MNKRIRKKQYRMIARWSKKQYTRKPSFQKYLWHMFLFGSTDPVKQPGPISEEIQRFINNAIERQKRVRTERQDHGSEDEYRAQYIGERIEKRD